MTSGVASAAVSTALPVTTGSLLCDQHHQALGSYHSGLSPPLDEWAFTQYVKWGNKGPWSCSLGIYRNFAIMIVEVTRARPQFKAMHRVLPCLMYCQGFWFSQRKNHGWCLKTWGREGIGEGGGGFFLGMPSLKQTLKWPGPIGPWKLTGASSWCGHRQNFNVNGNQRTITIHTIILNYFENNQFFSFWFRFVS